MGCRSARVYFKNRAKLEAGAASDENISSRMQQRANRRDLALACRSRLCAVREKKPILCLHGSTDPGTARSVALYHLRLPTSRTRTTSQLVVRLCASSQPPCRGPPDPDPAVWRTTRTRTRRRRGSAAPSPSRRSLRQRRRPRRHCSNRWDLRTTLRSPLMGRAVGLRGGTIILPLQRPWGCWRPIGVSTSGMCMRQGFRDDV